MATLATSSFPMLVRNVEMKHKSRGIKSRKTVLTSQVLGIQIVCVEYGSIWEVRPCPVEPL